MSEDQAPPPTPGWDSDEMKAARFRRKHEEWQRSSCLSGFGFAARHGPDTVTGRVLMLDHEDWAGTHELLAWLPQGPNAHAMVARHHRVALIGQEHASCPMTGLLSGLTVWSPRGAFRFNNKTGWQAQMSVAGWCCFEVL